MSVSSSDLSGGSPYTLLLTGEWMSDSYSVFLYVVDSNVLEHKAYAVA